MMTMTLLKVMLLLLFLLPLLSMLMMLTMVLVVMMTTMTNLMVYRLLLYGKLLIQQLFINHCCSCKGIKGNSR